MSRTEHINNITINRIKEILPQAYPFLMIDRIVEFKKGESLTAVKNVTGSEWIFGDGNKNSTAFPETLIIEAAAQAALAFFILNKNESNSKVPQVLLGKAKAEFFKSVFLGDQLELRVVSFKELGKSGFSTVEASVENAKSADVEVFYSMRS